MTKRLCLLTIACGTSLCASAAQSPERYVLVTSAVKIRLEANASAPIVAEGRSGDVFTLTGTAGKWYRIFMFSGEYRFLPQASAKVIASIPPLPANENLRRTACLEIVRSQDRASGEAERRYPDDFSRQIDFERVLNDGYELLIYRKYKLPPPRRGALVTECAKRRWIPK